MSRGGNGWADGIAKRGAIWAANAGLLLSGSTVLATVGLATLASIAIGWGIFRLAPTGVDTPPIGKAKQLKKP